MASIAELRERIESGEPKRWTYPPIVQVTRDQQIAGGQGPTEGEVLVDDAVSGRVYPIREVPPVRAASGDEFISEYGATPLGVSSGISDADLVKLVASSAGAPAKDFVAAIQRAKPADRSALIGELRTGMMGAASAQSALEEKAARDMKITPALKLAEEYADWKAKNPEKAPEDSWSRNLFRMGKSILAAGEGGPLGVKAAMRAPKVYDEMWGKEKKDLADARDRQLKELMLQFGLKQSDQASLAQQNEALNRQIGAIAKAQGIPFEAAKTMALQIAGIGERGLSAQDAAEQAFVNSKNQMAIGQAAAASAAGREEARDARKLQMALQLGDLADKGKLSKSQMRALGMTDGQGDMKLTGSLGDVGTMAEAIMRKNPQITYPQAMELAGEAARAAALGYQGKTAPAGQLKIAMPGGS